MFFNSSLWILRQERLHQRSSGKYQNAIEVIRTEIELLAKQENIYRRIRREVQQQAALVGWEASERGEVGEHPTFYLARAQARRKAVAD